MFRGYSDRTSCGCMNYNKDGSSVTDIMLQNLSERVRVDGWFSKAHKATVHILFLVISQLTNPNP